MISLSGSKLTLFWEVPRHGWGALVDNKANTDPLLLEYNRRVWGLEKTGLELCGWIDVVVSSPKLIIMQNRKFPGQSAGQICIRLLKGQPSILYFPLRI